MDRRTPGQPWIIDVLNSSYFRFMVSILVINIIIVAILQLCAFRLKNAVESVKKESQPPVVKEVVKKPKRSGHSFNQLVRGRDCSKTFLSISEVSSK